MAAVTLTIEPDELLGLTALATLSGTADRAGGGPGAGRGPGAGDGAVSEARALLDTALSDKLTRAGLPWAPSAEAVRRRLAAAGEPGGAKGARGLARSRAARQDTGYALAAAVAIVLWGGYARGWAWTGFRANGQLWDWLTLLLLPVVIGVIPLWIQYRRYIGRVRRAVYWAVIAAWTGFVIAGYVVPIGWTGFRGQTLWDWIGLLLLPAAVAVTMALSSMHLRPAQVLGALRPQAKVILAALAAAWVVTVIGGYAAGWRWTGYSGNTLWDWLQLLLLPLLVPTVLLPALLTWITGDAARRADPAPAVPAQRAAPGRKTGARA